MTPDNAGFATAAYVITAIVYLGYALSLQLRERQLRQRLSRQHAASRPTSSRPAGA